jgi:transposase
LISLALRLIGSSKGCVARWDRTRLDWTPATHSRSHAIIRVRFSAQDCTPRPNRSLCPQAKTNPRTLTLLPKEQHIARHIAQQQQSTPEFGQRYARRAGIEGTLSQGVWAFDLRRTRYLGLAKTHLQNVAIATAINLTRLAAYFSLTPKAQTRVSNFTALASFSSG